MRRAKRGVNNRSTRSFDRRFTRNAVNAGKGNLASKGNFACAWQPMIPRREKGRETGKKNRGGLPHRGELLTERIGESSDGKLNRHDRTPGWRPAMKEMTTLFFLRRSIRPTEKLMKPKDPYCSRNAQYNFV